MPLSHPPAGAHHGGMTTAPCPVDALTVERFVLRNDRGLRRPLAALFGPVPGSPAGLGVSTRVGCTARGARRRSSCRLRNGAGWYGTGRGLLDQAGGHHARRNPHAPLCRDRIIEAAGEVRALLGALATPLPVPARGVAMASRLLSDGTGPLYNRNCPVPLSDALAEVTAQLDPASLRYLDLDRELGQSVVGRLDGDRAWQGRTENRALATLRGDLGRGAGRGGSLPAWAWSGGSGRWDRPRRTPSPGSPPHRRP